MLGIAKKLFGSENDRKLKKFTPFITKINDLEKTVETLSDSELQYRTEEFRKRFKEGETLDALLPEAFATVREAAKRTLGQRHYDAQIIGGITLHRGEIAEMRTGEGKTLVATLAAYLNAIPQRGVHVVTVNDYLAQRDAEWMGQVYNFLGLTTGCIIHGLDDEQRRAAYQCDITYGTNNEYGFDYLRDNRKYSIDQMCQREHVYCIIDEIDSILIDEARTPLIISGPREDKSEFYKIVDEIIRELDPEGYDVDEKARSANFNEAGNEQIETILRERDLLKGESLYDIENILIVHHLNQALRAHKVQLIDRNYIVKDGRVVLIDEFTGRMKEGSRLSEGLHQAIEAKETVDIMPESTTFASITYQNYFRLYEKLAGMTGTALTEATEFYETYKLNVLEIPTNRPIQRIDDQDVIYRTEKEKYEAIVEEVTECAKKGQPILVGTASIEKSEALSKYLIQRGVEHNVLNARYNEQEASIVAQAGVPGAVTIATNMAGRGTDIQLGGNFEMRLSEEAPEGETEAAREKRGEVITAEIATAKDAALKAGGLYVLATERHESRRIDNQLRGRTGRQGDPGRSRFYLSTEDDLIRIFAGDKLKDMMGKMGWEEGDNLANPLMSKAVERAQRRVEAMHYDQRKNVLKYDDVMNDQRKAIFEQRLEFMTDDNVSDVIEGMRHELCENLVETHIPKKAFAEQWDVTGLQEDARKFMLIDLPLAEWAKEEGIADDEITKRMQDSTDMMFGELTKTIEPEQMRAIEKQILLQVIDKNWVEHLDALDALRSFVSMRGVAQRDPLNEYKSEAFQLFDKLLLNLREGVTQSISGLLMNAMMQRQQAQQQQEQKSAPSLATTGGPLAAAMGGVATGSTGAGSTGAGSTAAGTASPDHPSGASGTDAGAGAGTDIDPEALKGLSRNAACPCGSGRKIKHCHGNIRKA